MEEFLYQSARRTVYETINPFLLATLSSLESNTVSGMRLLLSMLGDLAPSIGEVYRCKSIVLKRAVEAKYGMDSCEKELGALGPVGKGLQAWRLKKQALVEIICDAVWEVQQYSKNKFEACPVAELPEEVRAADAKGITWTRIDEDAVVPNRFDLFGGGDGAKNANSYLWAWAFHRGDSHHCTQYNSKLHSIKAFTIGAFISAGTSKSAKPEDKRVLYAIMRPMFEFLESLKNVAIKLDGAWYLIDLSALRIHTSDWAEIRKMVAAEKAGPIGMAFAPGCCGMTQAEFAIAWKSPVSWIMELLVESPWVRECFANAPPLPGCPAASPVGSPYPPEAHWPGKDRFPLHQIQTTGVDTKKNCGVGTQPCQTCSYKDRAVDTHGLTLEQIECKKLELALGDLSHLVTQQEWEAILDHAAAVYRSLPSVGKKLWNKSLGCSLTVGFSVASWKSERSVDSCNLLWSALLRVPWEMKGRGVKKKAKGRGCSARAKKTYRSAALLAAEACLECIVTGHYVDWLSFKTKLADAEFRSKVPMFLSERAVALKTMGFTVADASKLDAGAQEIHLEHILQMELLTRIQLNEELRLSGSTEHRCKDLEYCAYDILLHGRGAIFTSLLSDIMAAFWRSSKHTKKDCTELYDYLHGVLKVGGIKPGIIEKASCATRYVDWTKLLGGSRKNLRTFVDQHAEGFINRIYDHYEAYPPQAAAPAAAAAAAPAPAPVGNDRALPSRANALRLLSDVREWFELLSAPEEQHTTDHSRFYKPEYCHSVQKKWIEIYVRVYSMFGPNASFFRKHYLICAATSLRSCVGLESWARSSSRVSRV